MAPPTTVLLLTSDHVGWVEVRAILAAMSAVRVVGEAVTIGELRALAADEPPDFIVAETIIEGSMSAPLLADLRRYLCPATRFILLGSSYVPRQTRAPLADGVVGYLLWGDLSNTALGHALALLIMNDIILANRTIVQQFVTALGNGEEKTSDLSLHPQEIAVLRELADGRSHESIAATLRISRRTVERVVAGLEQKLEVPNKFVLAMRATQLGLIGKAR